MPKDYTEFKTSQKESIVTWWEPATIQMAPTMAEEYPELLDMLSKLNLEHVLKEMVARGVTDLECLHVVTSVDDLQRLVPSLTSDENTLKCLQLYKAVCNLNGQAASSNTRQRETKKAGTAASGDIPWSELDEDYKIGRAVV